MWIYAYEPELHFSAKFLIGTTKLFMLSPEACVDFKNLNLSVALDHIIFRALPIFGRLNIPYVFVNDRTQLRKQNEALKLFPTFH